MCQSRQACASRRVRARTSTFLGRRQLSSVLIFSRDRTDPDGLLRASVQIENEQAQYDSTEIFPTRSAAQNPRETSCYIAAAEGKKYRVQLEDLRHVRSTDLRVKLFIDGLEVGDSAVENTTSRATTAQPFLFGKLQLTDDEDLATSSESVMRGIGTISISIYRVRILGDELPVYDFTNPRPAVIHERSKKAHVSHSTQFGQQFYSAALRSVSVHHIDLSNAPYHTFNILYRSRILLEIEGIAPSTDAGEEVSETAPKAGPSSSSAKKRSAPSEVIVIEDSDSDDGDVPDASAMAATIRRLKAENAALKKDKKPKVNPDPLAKQKPIVID